MYLSELATPCHRKTVICYRSDGKTPVLMRKALQQISGSIYRERPTQRDDSISFPIYACYDSPQLGVYLRVISVPETCTVEELMDGLQQRYATVESFIAFLDQCVETGSFIPHTHIEFARCAAPERVAAYIEARKKYEAMIRAEEAAQKAEIEAREEAYRKQCNEYAQSKIDAALQVIRNGGSIDNEGITIYHDKEKSGTYRLVNHIARLYGVKVPFKVQGWINSNLDRVIIENGEAVKCYVKNRKARSETFFTYMNQIIAAVQAAKKE